MIPETPARCWRYDAEDGRVLWDGGHVDFSRHGAAIWAALDRAYPHKVPAERLRNAIYPDSMPDADLPDDDANGLRMAISVVRRRLEAAHAPMTICRGNAFGYCIEATRQT